jgi:hypothetical protein
LLPRRRTAYRRVTPAAARRETQRRGAIAVLALVVVAGGLFTVVYAVGGSGPGKDLQTLSAGEAAYKTAQENIDKVFGPGVDLVEGDPDKAMNLLTEAYESLELARTNRISNARIEPLQAQAVAGLDRLYGVVPVAAATIISFKDSETPFDIGDMIVGPQGVPFVLDKATKSVYRIDMAKKTASVVFRSGTKVGSAREKDPRFITLGATRDLVIVDSANVVWRWRPSDNKGKGVTTKVRVANAASWGDDIRAIGTFIKDASAGLYNFYVVDPSEEQILAYPPAKDGSGFPADATKRLAVARDMTKVTDLYIDGDIFIADNGTVIRFVDGRAEGWQAKAPTDTLLREAPAYSLIASATDKRVGALYGYDKPNARVISLDKARGEYLAQYRLAGGADGWDDLRGMYVVLAGEDAPATLIWASKDGVFSSILEEVPDGPAGSAASSGSPGVSGSAAPAASGGASPAP